MSNHAAVSADGGEVGRAQAMQAAAAGIDVETTMNPILLKPSGEHRSHVVVRGRERGTTDAPGWGTRVDELRPVVLDAFTSLRRRFGVVVAEGAGGAAEINLLDRDVVNLPLAAAAGIRAVLVVDIERGGAFAAAHGTIDLLPEPLRATVGGVLLNRFRGDVSLLDPGITELQERTGVPVLGVLPHLGPDPLLGVEDSLDVGADPGASRSLDPLRIVAVRLPHLANPSDLDPLATEPDVHLTWATSPGDVLGADVVVVPGSRSTVADLSWLRERAIDAALRRTTATVIGVCAGLQLLGERIIDDLESGAGLVDGIGLLPVETVFEQPKVVRRRRGTIGAAPVTGYQIHLGRTAARGRPFVWFDDEHGAGGDGCIDDSGRVMGTSLHGVFDADGFRARLLATLARRHGRRVVPSDVAFASRLDAQHDRLADWLGQHADVDALRHLAAGAAAPGREPGW